MKKAFLIFFLCFLIFIELPGQKGYRPGIIVTNDFDTLVCFIKEQQNYLNARSCIAMKLGQDKPVVYTPSDLVAFRFEPGKYYVSKDVTIGNVTQKLFLEYLVNGIVNLYYLRDEANEKFFVEKNGQLTELNNDGKNITVIENENKADEKIVTYFKPSFQYMRMMTILFQDSPEILKRINTTPFSYKSMINLTVDYHNSVCKDKTCINYTKTTRQHFFIEPWIGYSFEKYFMKQSTGSIVSTTPAIGLNMRIMPFKGYLNWNFLFGFSYLKSSFDGSVDGNFIGYSGLSSICTYRIELKYSAIKVPVAAEYVFPVKKFRPFISVGIVNIYIPDAKPYAQNLDHNVGPEDPHFTHYHFGVSAGLGVRWELENGSYLFLKNDFEYNRPGSKFGWFFDFSRTFLSTASLGYGIKFR